MSANTRSFFSSVLPDSLRARLVLLVLLAVIPALALIFYTAREQRRLAERYAETDLRRLSQLVANEHRLLIDGSRHLLAVLAEIPAVRDQEAQACDQIVGRVAQAYPQYVGLGALKPNGDRFCGGNFAGAAPVNVADRPWFQQTLRTGNFTIGHYQIGRVSKRAALPLAYPARDESGKVRAVVLAVIDLEWLKSFVTRSISMENASLSIVDDKGVILAHHPRTEWAGLSITETALGRALRLESPGMHTLRGIDGIQRLTVFSSFSGGEKDSGAVHLILSMPRSQVYAEADQTLRRNLFWFGLVFVAVLGAAWFGGGMFVLRPIQALVQAAQRIAAGDLSARTEPIEGSGELSILGRSFNAMAASLQAREEETRRAEAKARESERLAAMGATVAGITHEIANPLNGMYSSVQALELELAQPGAQAQEEMRSILGYLRKEIERLRSLLQDLRFLVRSGNLNVEQVSLRDIVADIVAVQAAACKERGVRLETNIPASLPSIEGDGARLKQALLNLCKNAVEAMPNGGELRLSGYIEGREVVIEVSDTGIGIASGADVFELFTTNKASGLGLGLAITRQIVAAHAGAISYTSSLNGGTTFRISLPVAGSRIEQTC